MTDYNHTPTRKAWLASPAGKAAKAKADKKWRESDSGRAASDRNAKKWIAKNPVKRKAHQKVNNALRDNRLEKLDGCEHCGTAPVVAHHTSYSEDMWLCITWLCDPCHRTLHNEHNERVRA